MSTEAKAFANRLVEVLLEKGFVAQRAKSGVDVKELRTVAQVSHEMARRYAEGIAMPGADKIRAIANWLGVNVGWLRDGAGPKYQEGQERPAQAAASMAGAQAEYVMVPRYDLNDNSHDLILHSDQVVDYLAFRPDWIRQTLGVQHNDIILLTVRGDSMAPTLNNNDLVLVDMRANKVEDNAIYVLQLNGALVIKRVQRKFNGTVVIKCDNPAYEDEFLTPEEAHHLAVLGRVVWVGRQL
jgi:transcriptional regulator with XRE-family HTH domain